MIVRNSINIFHERFLISWLYLDYIRENLPKYGDHIINGEYDGDYSGEP